MNGNSVLVSSPASGGLPRALLTSHVSLWCPFVPSRVMTYREHTAWVVKAYLQKHPEGNIMSVRYPGWQPCSCLPSLTIWFSL